MDARQRDVGRDAGGADARAIDGVPHLHALPVARDHAAVVATIARLVP
jgi:hypothetical protein